MDLDENRNDMMIGGGGNENTDQNNNNNGFNRFPQFMSTTKRMLLHQNNGIDQTNLFNENQFTQGGAQIHQGSMFVI